MDKEQKKLAVIVACFYSYSYNTRLKYIEKALIEQGYKCIFIVSDFDHRTKQYVVNEKNNIRVVHTISYKKNISVRRLLSHMKFAKKSFILAESLHPDLIYVGSPPNSNVKWFSRFNRHKAAPKIVLSVSDVWPETFPVDNRKKRLLLPAFSLWSRIRNNYLSFYDGIIFECDLFHDYLRGFCKDVKTKTVYMAKEDTLNYESKSIVYEEAVNFTEIVFAYIGSLNNIVDIDLIIKLLNQVNQKRRTRLVIIGNGEKTDLLVDLCHSIGIEVTDYGVIFDDKEKEKVLRTCHYGLNIMKPSVFVGATMKSLEYLYFGLPLINTIEGDTHRLINDRHCGLNISHDNVSCISEEIVNMNSNDYLEMCSNSREVFFDYFSEKAISKQLNDFFKNVEQGERR